MIGGVGKYAAARRNVFGKFSEHPFRHAAKAQEQLVLRARFRSAFGKIKVRIHSFHRNIRLLFHEQTGIEELPVFIAQAVHARIGFQVHAHAYSEFFARLFHEQKVVVVREREDHVVSGSAQNFRFVKRGLQYEDILVHPRRADLRALVDERHCKRVAYPVQGVRDCGGAVAVAVALDDRA